MKISVQVRSSLKKYDRHKSSGNLYQDEIDQFFSMSRNLNVPRIHQNFDYAQILINKSKSGVVMRTSKYFWQDKFNQNVHDLNDKKLQQRQVETAISSRKSYHLQEPDRDSSHIQIDNSSKCNPEGNKSTLLHTQNESPEVKDSTAENVPLRKNDQI